MLAVTLHQPDAQDPASAITVEERPEPVARDGWATVRLKAASLNHHDVWSMRGVGIRPEWLPVVLGCDGAGIDDEGNEVVLHSLVADPAAEGGELLDPRRRLLSDGIDGTFAEVVAVPRRNLVAKPPGLSWHAAACLPTAWLTAYGMLFDAGALRPGQTILVQGAGGGLATALTVLGRAAGLRVWVTSRSEDKRERAVAELGADAAFAPDERLPERVDAVMESVGRATWAHSLRSVRPGGTVVVAGTTSGDDPPAELSRVFFQRLRIVGTAMGTRADLADLVRFCDVAGIAPPIDRVLPLADAAQGVRAMVDGELFGKVVLDCAG